VLRGKTFGVGAINAIRMPICSRSHRVAASSPTRMRVTALEGNAMWAAFQSKQIDGMSNSPPWPLKPVVDGLSVVIASGPDGDPPNAINFAYNVILAKPETCEKRRPICVAMGAVVKEAVAYMHAHPQRCWRSSQEISEPRAEADRGGLCRNPQVHAEGAGGHPGGAEQRGRLQRRGRDDEGVGQAEKL